MQPLNFMKELSSWATEKKSHFKLRFLSLKSNGFFSKDFEFFCGVRLFSVAFSYFVKFRHNQLILVITPDRSVLLVPNYVENSSHTSQIGQSHFFAKLHPHNLQPPPIHCRDFPLDSNQYFHVVLYVSV